MENQSTLNAISTLVSTIDAFNRAQERDAIKTVTEKILELVKKL